MIKYSIIIPIYNSRETLAICLSAIHKQIDNQAEIVVVDDCSTQKEIKEIVKSFTSHYYRLKKNSGAGKARNFGVKKARGEWLIFIDSDVVVSDNFFKEVIGKVKLLPANSCLQGVYGWRTPVSNIYSQYKNLYYYYNYFYRIKKENYAYLSSHCFILQRKVFEEVGGFNRQIRTVMEDADLGFRLIQKGFRILLDKKITVSHLKKFSLSGLLFNDAKLSFAKTKHILRNVFKEDKERLIVVSGGRVGEMYPVILSVIFAPFFLFLLPVALFYPNTVTFCLLVILLLLLIILNFGFFKFIGSKKGLTFLLKTIPIFYLDMLFAFFGTTAGVVDFFVFSRKY